jgi:hypothetical protein
MAYITAILSGGLGNQLFQIATAYAVAQDLGLIFKISHRNHSGPGQGKPPARYIDSIFSKLSFANDLLCSDSVIVHEHSWTYRSIEREVATTIAQCGYVCIRGLYQSDLYFRHRVADIRSLFTPFGGYSKWLVRSRPDIAALYSELLLDHSYCFIGVRRGDYMTPYNRTIHNPCGATYYREAMLRMPAERYYISSDDIEWCRQTFVGEQFYFIDCEDDIAKFALMTLFSRYIISNSSFYWWGSYLSVYEDASVIAPDKWIFGPAVLFHEYYSIYRADMTVVERPIEY